MGRELDNALNDCLEQMSSGGDIRQCVARYPEYERELVPLLETALATRQLASAARYSPQARARGLSRLMDAVNERSAPRRRSWLSFSILRPVVKPLAVGVAALVVMGFVAGGTTAAAADSVPGDRLYWVKTTKESITLRLPRSDIERAQTHAGLAGERGSEMRELISRGKVAKAEQVAVRIGSHLNRSAQYSGVFLTGIPMETSYRPPTVAARPQVVKLRATLQRDGGILRLEITQLVARMSPAEQHHIRRMMRRSELRYRILIDALNADRSSQRLPFWRVYSLRP